ncbi:MAG TPA: PAS domain S-box protein, partial [Leptolyngbyaceae cyanobacterium]
MPNSWFTPLSQADSELTFQNTPEILLWHRITLAVSTAETFESALEKVLHLVCSSTDWAFGEVWLPNSEGTYLHYSPIWYAARPELTPFGLASDGFTFYPGEGLPGRVWQAHQTYWIADVSCCPLFKRDAAASVVGLRAALGVPIQVGEQILAVLVFFMDKVSEQQPSQIALVSAIAKQLGGILHLKQTEAALKESQGRLQRLIDALPGIVFRSDRNFHHSMLYLSHGCYAMTGYRSEELTSPSPSLSYSDLIHPDDLPRISATLRRAILERQPYVTEYRIRTRSGEEKWLWEKGAGVFDEQQQLLGVEGFISDISDRKQAERTLKAREDFLQLILDSIPQSIFWKDRNSVYLGCNEAFARMIGLSSPKAIIGKTDLDFHHIPPEEATYYRARDRLVMKRGEADKHVLEASVKADGSYTWTDSSKIPVRDEGGTVIGVLCTVEDVTERMAAQRLLAQRENYLAALVE